MTPAEMKASVEALRAKGETLSAEESDILNLWDKLAAEKRAYEEYRRERISQRIDAGIKAGRLNKDRRESLLVRAMADETLLDEMILNPL